MTIATVNFGLRCAGEGNSWKRACHADAKALECEQWLAAIISRKSVPTKDARCVSGTNTCSCFVMP